MGDVKRKLRAIAKKVGQVGELQTHMVTKLGFREILPEEEE